jgi:flavin reductase (DIM6/NTAB) family NADH-FMN oxidoreductase RutF
VDFRTGETGAPILTSSLAWLDCRLWANYPGGDHTIFVGEVVAGDATDEAPLLFYRGGYGRFVP